MGLNSVRCTPADQIKRQLVAVYDQARQVMIKKRSSDFRSKKVHPPEIILDTPM